MDIEINAENAYKTLYDYDARELQDRINENREISIVKDVVLIDVRTPEEYQHEHLPCSLNIDHEDALRSISTLSRKWAGKKVIAICRSGGRSMLVVESLRQHGTEALSVRGGMMEWSRLKLPHWRP